MERIQAEEEAREKQKLEEERKLREQAQQAAKQAKKKAKKQEREKMEKAAEAKAAKKSPSSPKKECPQDKSKPHVNGVSASKSQPQSKQPCLAQNNTKKSPASQAPSVNEKPSHQKKAETEFDRQVKLLNEKRRKEQRRMEEEDRVQKEHQQQQQQRNDKLRKDLQSPTQLNNIEKPLLNKKTNKKAPASPPQQKQLPTKPRAMPLNSSKLPYDPKELIQANLPPKQGPQQRQQQQQQLQRQPAPPQQLKAQHKSHGAKYPAPGKECAHHKILTNNNQSLKPTQHQPQQHQPSPPKPQQSTHAMANGKVGGKSSKVSQLIIVITVFWWTAAQQVQQLFLHRGHDSFQNSSHWPRLSPAQYCFTVQHCCLTLSPCCSLTQCYY